MAKILNRKCKKCEKEFKGTQHAKYCSKECRYRLNINKNSTKEEIFNSCLNWQSARTQIRKDAKKNIELSGKEKTCENCKYNKHVEICHIKSVSDFEKESKLTEINSKRNLIYLCPNCHWEFDHGLLKISGRKWIRTTM